MMSTHRKGPARRTRSRPLRVLHIGNIANNAYNIAKALRERTDIEADVFTHGYNHYISQPEWEDADIPPVHFGEMEAPDWSNVGLKGFHRPVWYYEKPEDFPPNSEWSAPLRERLRVLNLCRAGTNVPDEVREFLEHVGESRDHGAIRTAHDLHQGWAATPPNSMTAKEWHRHLLSEYRRLLAPTLSPLKRKDIAYFVRRGANLVKVFAAYDIIQAYGVSEPMYPLLLAPSIPRVTFEHGSMREHPFRADALGRLLALSYKTAFRNIITNGDAIATIRRLGLDNCTFIPHPVDGAKFHPRETPLREHLLREHDCTHILLAPARQNWAVKGNDKMVRGFAELVRRWGKGPKLFMTGWGQETKRTADLVRELGLEDSVVWLPPLPKRRLAEYINASDAVLDQFVLGCFGTVTPEAMACAKPVLLHYRPEDHQWCFPEAPPVINARTPGEIAAALEALLADPEKREEIGRQGRQWYLEHHSINLVVQRHLDIYNAIAGSACVAPVPSVERYPLLGEILMAGKRVVAVVRCAKPLDVQGQPRYLRKICGVPLIEIMDQRLRRVPGICHVVMIMGEPDPDTHAAVKRLGWRVIRRWKRPLPSLATLYHLVRCDFLAFFNLEHPFVMREAVSRVMRAIQRDKLADVQVAGNINHCPSRILHRSLAIRTVLFKLAMRGLPVSWRESFQSVLPYFDHREIPSPENRIQTGVNARTATTTFVEKLGGPDFKLEDLLDFEKDIEGLRRFLREEMEQSDVPHLVNARLNELERRNRCSELLSFPTYVGLNLSAYCNMRCKFCSYHPEKMKQQSMLTLEQFRKMTWLKYVGRLSLFAGIGESLVNPEFPQILEHACRTYPHLGIDFLTNGKGLTRELVEHILNLPVQTVQCSLNAARKATYDNLTERGDFDSTVSMLALLVLRRNALGRKTPRLGMSIVLLRENIEEFPDFVRLAAEVGADYVSSCHYVSTTTMGERKLSAESSLYYHRELADRMFAEADKVAEQTNMELMRPPMFREPHSLMGGMRIKKQETVPPCGEPWRTAYLTVDEEGVPQFIFCCSGVYYGILYDRDELGEENFLKLWNHGIARHFRRTVNKRGENPLCERCFTVDRFEPGENVRELDAVMQGMFEEMR